MSGSANAVGSAATLESTSGLRTFIEELEKDNEFIYLKKKVQSGDEVFSIMWRLNSTHGPAFQADVEGFDVPIVANLFGTLSRWGRACGLERDLSLPAYVDRFISLMDGKDGSRAAEPVVVSDAPCKEVKLLGPAVDLNRYPILQWHKLDGAPYITMGMCVTQDEKFGRNVGLYRVSVIGKDTVTIMTNTNQDIGIHVSRARAGGKKSMPVAIVIGADPAVYMASITKVDLREDELRFASRFNGGRSIETVKCETSDIQVPASSEIVLEGALQFDASVKEGPFAEYGGYVEECMRTFTIKINCITQKKRPVYVTTTAGHVDSEEEVVRVVQFNSTLNRHCRDRVTGFVRAGLPQSGRGYTAVVAINKRIPGWGKHAIMQVYGIPYVALTVNNIIIVDDDIDPYDSEQVMWALSTRVDPQRDVVIFPPAGVNPLNPAARMRPDVFSATGLTDVAICSKMGVDATLKKFGELEEHFRPAAVPVRPDKKMYERVCEHWSEYGF